MDDRTAAVWREGYRLIADLACLACLWGATYFLYREEWWTLSFLGLVLSVLSTISAGSSERAI